MKKPFNKLLTLSVVALALTSCGLTQGEKSTGGGSASTIYDIKNSNQGQALDAAAALTEIKSRQNDFAARVRDLLNGGRVGYMGGYLEYADGSGAEFPTTCGTMMDGKDGCYRSGEQRMYSPNGMGQTAPSKNARINDLPVLTLETIARSLESGQSGTGYYSQIQVSTGATVEGDVGFEKGITKTNCLHAQGKDDAYRMEFEFWDCGDMMLGRTKRKGNLAGAKSYWFVKKGSSSGSNSNQSAVNYDQ